MEENQDTILEAKATLKHARISARKVKIVADLIRGKDVQRALAIVKFTPKAANSWKIIKISYSKCREQSQYEQ